MASCGKAGRRASFSEALGEAAADLIGRRWRPDPFPTWVTCVPSTRHPDLVPLFAERLAKALELPFLPVLSKTRETAPQAGQWRGLAVRLRESRQ